MELYCDCIVWDAAAVTTTEHAQPHDSRCGLGEGCCGGFIDPLADVTEPVTDDTQFEASAGLTQQAANSVDLGGESGVAPPPTPDDQPTRESVANEGPVTELAPTSIDTPRDSQKAGGHSWDDATVVTSQDAFTISDATTG